MDQDIIKIFKILSNIFSIGTGVTLAYAAILYSKKPFIEGNEVIKEQMYTSLVIAGGFFLSACMAHFLIRMTYKFKAYLWKTTA